MKTKMLILALIMLCASCAKDNSSAPTTGGLIIKAKLSTSTGYLSGVDIGIATSQVNLDNGVYLQDKITNSQGQADFGQLNAANYYYDGYTTIGSTSYYGEGQIQITAGNNKTLTLIIY